MRPRRIRRGEELRREGLFGLVQSFNEAPANSPGRARAPGTARACARCFNEAPANSPGRAGILAIERAVPHGFNEAPANSPGRERDPEHGRGGQ